MGEVVDDQTWDIACAAAGIRSERLSEVDEMIRVYQQDGMMAHAMWPPGSDARHAMSAVVLLRRGRG
jgi:hypothetical protein